MGKTLIKRFAARRWSGAAERLLALGVMLTLAAPSSGQQKAPEQEPSAADNARTAVRDAFERIWVPRYRLTNSTHMRAVFHEVVSDVSRATVRVRSAGRTRSLGGIVGPDGWVLTKASRLGEQPTVLLKDQREFDARVVGIDRDYDLAVLKIDAKDLPTLTLAEDADATPGDWVATPGAGRDPVSIGVVSVLPRKIAHRPGILGVQLDDAVGFDEGGAVIMKVFADTGAERAGVQVNDVVVSINGARVKSRIDLIREVRRYNPLDEIELEVVRGDERLTLVAVLTGKVKEMFRQSRSEYQNSLGSKLSQRRFGFPSALQHDSVLKPEECGGPLVDLDGRVVGFNIARAGRTESYAVPTAKVLPLLYKLMSGKQPPGDEQEG